MSRYIEIPTDADLALLRVALWVRWATLRRALYQAWASLPNDQVPSWYVRAGRPTPPTPQEGLDWNVAQARWVWHTVACPSVASAEITGGGALMRVRDEWEIEAGAVPMVDTADARFAAADNTSELHGAGLPARQARFALGLPVDRVRIPDAASFDLGAVPKITREQVSGRYLEGLGGLPLNVVSVNRG